VLERAGTRAGAAAGLCRSVSAGGGGGEDLAEWGGLVPEELAEAGVGDGELAVPAGGEDPEQE
jgi:hypothetical protein